MNGVSEFAAQSDLLAGWLAGLADDDFGAASVLEEWDVRTLLAHIVLIRRGLVRVLDTRIEERAVPAAEYVRRYRRDVAEIASSTAATAADQSPVDLLEAVRVPLEIPAAGEREVLAGPRGPITARDWVATRLVDLVVHCDDFSATFPDREPVPLNRGALATAVRTLAEILAAQAPGRSVEVRIPPFIAVQAVAGPRHTRGTPPNVVETDPLTWLRVATGRRTFAGALADGSLTASGLRADLTGYLPVLS